MQKVVKRLAVLVLQATRLGTLACYRTFLSWSGNNPNESTVQLCETPSMYSLSSSSFVTFWKKTRLLGLIGYLTKPERRKMYLTNCCHLMSTLDYFRVNLVTISRMYHRLPQLKYRYELWLMSCSIRNHFPTDFRVWIP